MTLTPAHEAAVRAATDALVAALLDAVRAETATVASAPERLFSIEDARVALGGLARSSIYKEIGAGRLRSCLAGRRRMIPASAIEDYVSRLMAQTREQRSWPR